MTNDENRCTDRVETFYGQHNGWRMFDGRMLTPEVAAYLVEEKRLVAEYLEEAGEALEQFIEVGCGYGRYLHVALKHGVSYRGIELVGWLAALGKARVTACPLPPNCSAQIEHLSAEHLHCVLPDSDIDIAGKSCLFFPFNCFGNLRDPLRVLAELKGRNTEVIISGFASNEQATLARMAYYQQCGCTDLRCRVTERGVEISSREFLQSLAYDAENLEIMLNEFGFRLTQRIAHSTIGELFFFSPYSPLRQEVATPPPSYPEPFLLQGFIEEGRSHDLLGHIEANAWGLAKNAGLLTVITHDVGWREGGLAWLVCSSARQSSILPIATGTISCVVESTRAAGTVKLLINTY